MSPLGGLGARAASLVHRFAASTPRISRTGTSSLFASCTLTSAIFRGSPSKRPSRSRNTSGTNRPWPHTPAASPAHSDQRAVPVVRIPPGSSVQTLTPNGATSIASESLNRPRPTWPRDTRMPEPRGGHRPKTPERCDRPSACASPAQRRVFVHHAVKALSTIAWKSSALNLLERRQTSRNRIVD